jgi:hypothetical protein
MRENGLSLVSWRDHGRNRSHVDIIIVAGCFLYGSTPALQHRKNSGPHLAIPFDAHRAHHEARAKPLTLLDPA